jgi:hypothetical protein
MKLVPCNRQMFPAMRLQKYVVRLLESENICSMTVLKGVNATPLRFLCKIEPRSEEKAAAIRRHYLEQADVLRSFEQHISDGDKEFVEASRKLGGICR